MTLGLTTACMRFSNLKVFVACLLLLSCSRLTSPPRKVWRASVDHGDKPGIGIELIRTAQGVSGWVYLFDPNKPHDFSAAPRHKMGIQQTGEREIRFAVEWLSSRRDEMILQLASPLESGPVHAILRSAAVDRSPTELVFVRAE
jgi:hypothetical protein